MRKSYPMAVVKAPGEIDYEERFLPALAPRELLIGVKAVSICGSDLHVFEGKHPFAPLPAAFGHELTGVVLETGDQVKRFREGDRVVVEPVLVCGCCPYCLRGAYNLCTKLSFQHRQGQGAMAPYYLVDEDWAHLLPANVSFEVGSLIEPLAVAVHAARKGDLQIGHSLAIFGAGAIGLLILRVARLSGIAEIYAVDIQDFRLNKAKELGASAVFNNADGDVTAAILARTEELGVDRSFEAVGLELTLSQCLEVLKKGGKATVIGLFRDPEIRVRPNLFIQKEISLIGSQGYCWDFQTALKILAHEQLDLSELITHELSLSSLPEAFEILRDPAHQAIKVVIRVD